MTDIVTHWYKHVVMELIWVVIGLVFVPISMGMNHVDVGKWILRITSRALVSRAKWGVSHIGFVRSRVTIENETRWILRSRFRKSGGRDARGILLKLALVIGSWLLALKGILGYSHSTRRLVLTLEFENSPDILIIWTFSLSSLQWLSFLPQSC